MTTAAPTLGWSEPAAFVRAVRATARSRPATRATTDSRRPTSPRSAALRASGAGCLIAVGPLDRPEHVAAYTAALPAAAITLCRLHASREAVADRVARRGRGLTPTSGLAGDELIGQPQVRLREIADQVARIVDALDGVGDLRVDTDDRPPDQIAAQILGRTGWPSLLR